MVQFSQKAKEHFMNPKNVGVINDAEAVGEAGKPGYGNFFIIYLKIEDGMIQRASFQTYGCPGVISCGSALTELLTGISLNQAEKLMPDELEAFLDGLPLGKKHCATLAVTALKNALDKIKH